MLLSACSLLISPAWEGPVTMSSRFLSGPTPNPLDVSKLSKNRYMAWETRSAGGTLTKLVIAIESVAPRSDPHCVIVLASMNDSSSPSDNTWKRNNSGLSYKFLIMILFSSVFKQTALLVIFR
jgi:hypothetical protein